MSAASGAGPASGSLWRTRPYASANGRRQTKQLASPLRAQGSPLVLAARTRTRLHAFGRASLRVRSDNDWLDDDDAVSVAPSAPPAAAASPVSQAQAQAPDAARAAPAALAANRDADTAAQPVAAPAHSPAAPEPVASAPVPVPGKKKTARASVRPAPPTPQPTVFGLSPTIAGGVGLAGAAAIYLGWKAMSGRSTPAPVGTDAPADGTLPAPAGNPIAQLQQARTRTSRL